MTKGLYLFIFCLGINFTSAQESLFSKVSDIIGIKAALPCNCRYETSVDLSQKMPPVQNQYILNSCVGWSLGYACRSYYHKILDKAEYINRNTLDSANVVSPSFIYNSLNNQKDNGINLLRAVNFLQETGACSFKMMPDRDYTKKPTAAQVKAAAEYKIYSFRRLGNDKAQVPQEEIKSALLCGDPVIVAMRSDMDYFSNAKSAEKAVWKSYKKLSGSHAVVIVGYDDKKALFKFMNSAGTGWGDKGFGWLSYKIAGDIIKEAYVIKPDKPWYATILGKGLDSLPKADILIDSIVSQNLKLTLEEKDPLTTTDGRMRLKTEVLNKNPVVNTMCQNWKIMVRFFTVNSKGETIPLTNTTQINKLANGQVAFNAPYASGQACTWEAKVFYSDLFPAKSKSKNSKTILKAEPVLYIDNNPVSAGKRIEITW